MVAGSNRKEQDAEVLGMAVVRVHTTVGGASEHDSAGFATRLPGYSLFVPLRRANTHTSPRLTPQNPVPTASSRSLLLILPSLRLPKTTQQIKGSDVWLVGGGTSVSSWQAD